LVYKDELHAACGLKSLDCHKGTVKNSRHTTNYEIKNNTKSPENKHNSIRSVFELAQATTDIENFFKNKQ